MGTKVCVECLPVDKPWDVVSVTRRSSGVAPRACVRVYARVLVPCARVRACAGAGAADESVYVHTHDPHARDPQPRAPPGPSRPKRKLQVKKDERRNNKGRGRGYVCVRVYAARGLTG